MLLQFFEASEFPTAANIVQACITDRMIMINNNPHATNSVTPIEKTAVALFIPPQSASLHWNPYLAHLGSSTAIEWWRQRLRHSAYFKHCVIVQNDQQSSALGDANLGDVTVLNTSFTSSTEALAKIAKEKDFDHIALVTLATAFGPIELLDEMFSRHLSMGNSMTLSKGLPLGVGATIFTRSVLELLSSHRYPGLPPHPEMAYRKLRAAIRANEVADVPIALREEVIDASARYGFKPSDMPMSVSLSTAEELEIAQEVLRGAANPRGVDALLRWKQRQIHLNEERFDYRRSSPHSIVPRALRPRRPKILYISNPSAYSGAEESLVQLVQKIDRGRFETFAATGMPGLFRCKLEEAGAQSFPFTDGFAEPSLKNFIAISDLLDELKPDLIHSNAIDGLPFLWNAVERKIPFIQHVRNGEMSRYKDYVESAAAVIAVSHYLRDGIMRYAVNGKKVHVIYDEVDAEWFYPGAYDKRAERARYGIKPDAKVMIMIARFAENKRHDLILDAFQQIQERVPSAHLVLKGEVYRQDKYYDGIKKRIESLNRNHAITHIPFVDDIRKIHSMADVIVLCSDREGLGRCIVESMSMETPAVVTDTGGSHEIIDHGISGIVARGGDAAAIAEGVIRYFEDEDFRIRSGHAARRAVEQRLTSEISASRIMDIYDAALSAGDLTWAKAV